MLTHDNMDQLAVASGGVRNGCASRAEMQQIFLKVGGNPLDNHPLKCYYNQAFSKIANMREWWNWQTR